ncbi:MAG: T9SS type A sorting domain-containing protein [Flavobacteriaceae bacterium]
MKKPLLLCAIGATVVGALSFSIYNQSDNNQNEDIANLRATHSEFLNNSPFKETLQLSKKERKAIGLPGNKYNERQWELTMNPELGYPEPYKVEALQKSLREQRAAGRAPGDGANGDWVERGPNNVGGRTRALLFDPNDGTNRRVFAGAVSGGLWVNNDITSDNAWTQVTGVPGNLNVSSITVDPNNSNIWYIGTGESYTAGDVVGNGVYKTTDGGANWVQVMSVNEFVTDQSNPAYEIIGGLHYVNDVLAWDNNGSTEIYVAVGTHVYGAAGGVTNYLGAFDPGLYQSTDGGANWTKDAVVGDKSANDLEVDANGNLWMATANTVGLGTQGGHIYRRAQGAATNFSLIRTLASNVLRTEIEPSATNANKFYVLTQTTTGNPVISVTTNAFATAPTAVALPNDPDGSVPATDFTRGQSFYDLVLEADPTNDAIVYVGGINVHRSTNSGASWNTISHWSAGWSTAGSPVHADQHALVFRPGNSNQAVLGHDGGVSYASNLSATGNNLTVISDRITNYNATQFYSVGVAPTAFASGDYFLAGAQDNGTQYIQDGNASGPDSSAQIKGGDGAFSAFDQVLTGSGYLIGNYVYNESIQLYDFDAGAWRDLDNDSNANNGGFICQQALDSNLDLLYTDYSSGASYRIRRYSNIVSGAIGRDNLTNALLTNSPTAMRVSPYTTTSTKLLVGTADGKVLRIDNANSFSPSWNDITPPAIIGSVSDVEFGQSENEIFVTVHNYAVTSIWYTSNGGSTWANKEGNLPDMPVKCILQNPLDTDEVIVGTELGVWYTSDFTVANPVWNQSYNGMSDVKVTDLQLRDDNKVFAATFGRGVFSGDFTNNSVLDTPDNDLVANAVKVYPTVTSGGVFIKSSVNLNNTDVNVYDINGKLVYNTVLTINTEASQKINLGLNAGMYFVKLSNKTLNKTTKVIVK